MLRTTTLFVLLSILHVVASPDQQNVTAHPGDNVVLKCEAPRNTTINVAKWKKDGLSKHVYFNRDGHSIEPRDQDPSYIGRVDLVDREMKDGNLSLNLKNVSHNDTGTYECSADKVTLARVVLNVTEADHTAVAVAVAVTAFVFFVALIMIYRRLSKNLKCGQNDVAVLFTRWYEGFKQVVEKLI
ncbi:butyrophilin subfamily 1 member A1 [Dicentrarchus labrax]|uniref:butyrophilin subfamily 1 member A1 n=1 Tax=Dicentrarchus labrax TaxID=13489 RepID=UPI0021F51EE7|nr:butyrophilin subfamily 1 member A1 [Dicentrarchus labrax]